MPIFFKLPKSFVDTFGETLETVDWPRAGRVSVDVGFDEKPLLEAIARHGQTIVRPATARSAVLIRRKANEIEMADPDRYPAPSTEEITLVLASRNQPEVDAP